MYFQRQPGVNLIHISKF